MDFVWRIAGAITGATLVSAVIAVWALVKCVHDRANKEEWKSELALAALGVLGVILTIGGELASQDVAAELSRQLENAQDSATTAMEEVADARSDLVKSEAKVAELLTVNQRIALAVENRAVLITPEIESQLVDRFRQELAGVSIGVATIDADGETIELSQILLDLLKRADCSTSDGHFKVVRLSPRASVGRIVVQFKPEKNRIAAESLAAILTDVGGLPGVVIDEGRPPMTLGDIHLLIKPR